MASQYICDGCGKVAPAGRIGRDWGKPRDWFQRSDDCKRDGEDECGAADMTDASGITPASDELVADLERLYAAAIPAPWGIGEPGGPQGPFPMLWNTEKGYIVAPQVEGRATSEAIAGIHNAFPALLARLREAEGRTQLVEAEHATLMSMVEKAASTLRDLADLDDEGSPRLMVIAAEAKRTLKAMREIGGIE